MATKNNGGGGFDPNVRVKVEKSDAEKIYQMTETADTMKCAIGDLFPLKPPQKLSRLKTMFSAPRGVTPYKRNARFFKFFVHDIGVVDVKSKTTFGPSSALQRVFMKKDQLPQQLKNQHTFYASENLLFIKVNGVQVLVFDKAQFLKNSNDDDMRNCLFNSRKRWFAANLIRFPTSPQVIAAQLVRNHARVYSEDSREIADPNEYQNSVKRLIYQCTGLDRALMPEGHMPVESHMKMTWHRIRRRVLERMVEEVNGMQPNTEKEKAFYAAMPFGIKNAIQLLAHINDLMAECDALWAKEQEGEIELSDGPEMEDEEEMERDESMEGNVMQNEQAEKTGKGEKEQELLQRAPSQMMLMQQPQSMHQQRYPLLPPSSYASTSNKSRMNQLYDYGQQQKKQHMQAGTTLATVLAPQLLMGATSSAASRGRPVQQNGRGGGRGTALPQMTPTSSGGERGGMKTKRDEQKEKEKEVEVEKTPSVTISTTLPREDTQQKPPSDAPSTAQQQSVQPPPILPTPPVPPTPHVPPTPPVAHPMQPVTPHVVPPRGNDATPGQGDSSFVHPPFFSSPQLIVMGADGVMQSLPSVVYVESTEKGLMQVNPPSPQPHLMLTIPSTGGRRRERSHSIGKRRVSLVQQLMKRRRMDYDGDGSSEGSEEDEQKQRERANERRKKYEREKIEDIERREKEEREEKEKEEKEEEEFRKKEEEAKKKNEEERKKKEEDDRIEMERVRKEEEELKAAVEREREEEERKKKEEEEEAAKRMEEEPRMEEKDEYEENGEEEGEDVRVLAKDSSDESETDDRMESEDEVVAESVVTQSDNEGMEEEKVKEGEVIDDGGEKGRGDERAAEVREGGRENEQENGVAAPRPIEDGGDSDIEVVYEGRGKEKTTGYCEVVEEIRKVKRELDEDARNDVVYLTEKKTARKEGKNKVKEESVNPAELSKESRPMMNVTRVEIPLERNEKDGEGGGVEAVRTPPITQLERVKTEEEEDEVSKGEFNSENSQYAGVKSEVKEEEMEEDEEEEQGETMIERREGDNEENVEDTLNRSGELDFLVGGEDEDIERKRIVLEAMTQEDSSQVPFTVAHSDDVSTVTAVSPIESAPSSPMDTTTLSGGTEEVTSLTTLTTPIETPHVMAVESGGRVSTPSPRPVPIRASSLPLTQSTTIVGGGAMPPLQTRLTPQQIEMISNADSLMISYRKSFERRDQREAEKEKETEKEKEGEVEIVNEIAPLETDPHILRFHIMRGESATLSENRRRASREESIDSYCNALVFTNRTLFKGERITLRVTEISPDRRGRIRLGLTTKNPLSYPSRKEIPRILKSDSEDGNLSYLFDSGVMNPVKMGTELEVELNEKGDELNYWFDGVRMGAMGGGLQMARPMWMAVDLSGFVKGVEIVGSVLPQELPRAEDHIGNVFKKEPFEEPMVNVKKELKKEEESSHCPPSDDTPIEEEREMDNREMPMIPNEIIPVLPVETITVESSEMRGEEQGEEGTGEKVMEDGCISEEKEGGEDVNVEGEEEEVSVEDVVGEEEEKETDKNGVEEEEEKETDKNGVEEEEEEPPMKKMRIDLESSNVAVEEKKEEKEKEKEVKESVEDEEKNIEESAVESVDGVEEAAIDEANTGDMTDGEVGVTKMIEEDEKKGGIIVEKEGEESMEDTVEKEEKEEETAVMGMTRNGDANEEIASVTVEKEDEDKDEEMAEESSDIRYCEVSLNDRVIGMPIGTEEEGEETVIAIPIESTEEEEEKMEIEEPTLAPPRRRSLFGPGCLSFNRTLDAKEKNGNEEEKEENMEVDKDEMEGVPSIRRLSLFGPGSASISHILDKINGKP